MKICLLLFSYGALSSAQLVSFGVNVGSQIGTSTYSHNDSKPFLVGPVIEFHPLKNLGLEVGAIYSQSSQTALFQAFSIAQPSLVDLAGMNSVVSYRETGDSWQFPVLGKYYFRSHETRLQPFAGIGFAFRTTDYHVDGNTFSIPSGANLASVTPVHQDFRSDLGFGGVAAAGLRYRITNRIALEPQLRYTYWNGADALRRHNEGSFQLGVRF